LASLFFTESHEKRHFFFDFELLKNSKYLGDRCIS